MTDRFLHCKLSLYPSIWYPLEGSHYVQPTLKEWGVMLHIFKDREPIYIIWNSFAWEISLPFIYLFIYSIMCFYPCVLIDMYFKLWIMTQYYVILLLKLFLLWPSRDLSVGSYILWHTPITVFCFWALLYFLLLQDVAGSCCIFLDPVLESVISPEYSFLSLEDGLGTGCAPCY